MICYVSRHRIYVYTVKRREPFLRNTAAYIWPFPAMGFTFFVCYTVSPPPPPPPSPLPPHNFESSNPINSGWQQSFFRRTLFFIMRSAATFSFAHFLRTPCSQSNTGMLLCCRSVIFVNPLRTSPRANVEYYFRVFLLQLTATKLNFTLKLSLFPRLASVYLQLTQF